MVRHIVIYGCNRLAHTPLDPDLCNGTWKVFASHTQGPLDIGLSKKMFSELVHPLPKSVVVKRLHFDWSLERLDTLVVTSHGPPARLEPYI